VSPPVVHDSRVVVGGQALDKAGGKTRNADQTISIDRATIAVLRQWRVVQDGERDFFASPTTQVTSYSPIKMADLCIRTRSDGV
jgi:hypothetical protein